METCLYHLRKLSSCLQLHKTKQVGWALYSRLFRENFHMFRTGDLFCIVIDKQKMVGWVLDAKLLLY